MGFQTLTPARPRLSGVPQMPVVNRALCLLPWVAPRVEERIYSGLTTEQRRSRQKRLNAAAVYYTVMVQDAAKMTQRALYSHRRTVSVVKARHILYWLLRDYTDMSLPEIGKRISGRDHTTILYGARCVDRAIETCALGRVSDAAEMTRRLWDAAQAGRW